jgi:hypothetical protein
MKGIQPEAAPVKEKKTKKVEAPMDTPLAESLLEAIEKSIGESIDGRYKQRKGFVPSETNQCARYLVYLLRGIYVPATHNSRTQRIFDNGNEFHTRIARYLAEMGILSDVETPIYSGIGIPVPVYGFIDGILDWQGKRVVEFKSINDFGFMAVMKMKRPKDDHYRQIQMYLACLGMESGFVIYENKNDQNILIFEVQKNEEFLLKLFAKYDKIYKQYKEGILPDRPFKSITSKGCQYCAIKDVCWSDPEGTQVKEEIIESF